MSCLLLRFRKYRDYKRKNSRVTILLASEHPQYVEEQLIDWEVKDRFVYRNINLKTKTSIQTAFSKNTNTCHLLSTIITNCYSLIQPNDILQQAIVINQPYPADRNPTSKSGYKQLIKLFPPSKNGRAYLRLTKQIHNKFN